jgi:hypothetical protein
MSRLTQPESVDTIENITVIDYTSKQPDKASKTKNYEIRIATSKQEMARVYRLTHDAYVDMNYAKPQSGGKLIHYPELENIPETTVMIASSGSRLLGSLSITIDGPMGLNTDKDFPQLTRQIRSQTNKLASCWRMATCKECRGKKSIVKDLLKASVCYIFQQLEIDTLLCIVNPCHERIYQLLFGFETIARQDSSLQGLENAPAVLMRLEHKNVPERWFT